MTVTAKPHYDEIDLSSRKFWSMTADDRDPSFASLCEHRPVSWHHPPKDSGLVHGHAAPGFWAVVTHAGSVEVSRRSDVFLSSKGVHFEAVPEDLMEAALSVLAMDGARHATVRRLIRSAFTPRNVARLVASIEGNSKRIVGELAAAGSGCDFVRNCAVKLPLVTFSDIVGVPDEQRDRVRDAADAMVSVSDPHFMQGRNPLEVLLSNTMFLHQGAVEMAEERRRSPRDDIMTTLVQAKIGGERLTNSEIGAFFVLLSVAGNDTTRQTTSLALHALTQHPRQREWLLADYDRRIDTAVEEFVRWATPVMTFARTAAQDYELGGQHISAGDKVVMFYSSGNRDAMAFHHPERFDLSRELPRCPASEGAVAGAVS